MALLQKKNEQRRLEALENFAEGRKEKINVGRDNKSAHRNSNNNNQ